jgi:hypothetical protein
MRCQVFNRELTTSLDSEYFMSCFNAYATFLKPVRKTSSTTAASATASATAASSSSSASSYGFEWSLHDSSKYSTRWSLDEFQVVYIPDHRGKITERVKRARIRPNFAVHNPFDVYVDPSIPLDYNFKAGQGVEIQWRQRRDHPFGWWYGEFQSIDPKTKKMRITFEQYYTISPWYVVTPILGTTQPTPGTSGELGGLRLVTDPNDIARWKSFLPAYKLV